jgi:hypothetical protein
MPSQQYTYLNSTLVKEVARLGGKIRGLVPRPVEDRLRRRLLGDAAAKVPAPATRQAASVPGAPAANPAMAREARAARRTRKVR